MSKSKLLALTVFTALAGAVPVAAAVTDAQILAVAEPDRQLEIMLAAGFFENPAGPQSFYALGIKPGCAALRRSVAAAVAANRAAWSANVLAAYRTAVPADQLATIVKLPPERAAPLLEPLRPAIGTAMQASSEARLTAATATVVGEVQRAAAGVDVAKVDRAARDRELVAAQAADTQYCGLLPPEPRGDGPPPPAR